MSTFLFIAFPYIALVLAIGVGIYRYYSRRFSYSSLSSQLLENRRLFWGSVPWHYGITLILLAHLLAGLFPQVAGTILGNRIRLVVLEMTGVSLALFALVGIIVLIIRRLPSNSRVRSVTSIMDGVVLFFLLVQVVTGIIIALFDRWGSVWYLKTAVPWFWSLVLLHPNASTVSFLPPFVKFHFVWGFAVILLFPFSRLVHVIKFPLPYLWRPYQVVMWNRKTPWETSHPESSK